MCLRNFICRLLTGIDSRSKIPGRNQQLLEHFASQLRDVFLYAGSPANGDAPIVNAPIIARIVELIKLCDLPLAGDDDALRRRWENVYEIERLLVYVRPRSQLTIEAEARVDEAKRIGLPSADKYRAQLDAASARVTSAKAAVVTAATAAAAASDVDKNRMALTSDQAQKNADTEETAAELVRRAVLAAVLDDLHWQYQKNNVVQSALWESASNLLAFGCFTTFIVGVPFGCFVFEKWTGYLWFSHLLVNFPNYGLYTAMSFGLLGAFFSRLISLKFSTKDLTLEDAENRYSLKSLAIRGAVGTSGALLFYYLMRTGVISGIAPDFEKFEFKSLDVQSVLASTKVLIPSKDWSLLVLYSFLAGFSEKLVPDSLAKVEAEVAGKKDK